MNSVINKKFARVDFEPDTQTLSYLPVHTFVFLSCVNLYKH